MREKKVEKEIRMERVKNVKSVVIREKCKECGMQLIVHGWNSNANVKICANDHCALSHSPRGSGNNNLDNNMIDFEATMKRHSKYRREELEMVLLGLVIACLQILINVSVK